MVPGAGLEPAHRFMAGDFKSPVSTYFTIRAKNLLWYSPKIYFGIHGASEGTRTPNQRIMSPLL